MMLCDLSVIIPNFNRTAPLKRALLSIQHQTIQPREVIIIDDCSSSGAIDEIKKIVWEIGQSLPIRLIINDTNRGANYSRNRGISEALSRYIAFLDSDDIWLPNKLEIQLAAIEKVRSNGRPILSATGRYRVDSTGRILAQQFGGKLLSASKIRQSNFIGTLSSIVVDTWIARHIHGFDETLKACQDWDFFIRLSEYVQYIGVSEPLCIYVDHDEARITLNNKSRLRAHLYIYKKHIQNWRRRGEVSVTELHRNIAEDFQGLNRPIQARKFYPAPSFWGQKWLRNRLPLALAVSTCIYSFINPSLPSLKETRYAGYMRRMKKAMKNEHERAKLARDGELIRKMMSAI